MGYSVDGRIGTTITGVFVPLGQEHIFWNAHPTKDLRMKVRLLLHTGNTDQAIFYRSMFLYVYEFKRLWLQQHSYKHHWQDSKTIFYIIKNVLAVVR